MADEWWSIEVLSGRTTAAMWREAHGQALTESAVTNRASGWEWHAFAWGVVFEVRFPDEAGWQAWRGLPGVRSALDAVPDPFAGLLVYRGRGGASGSRVPRRPRRSPGAASVVPGGRARPREGRPAADQFAIT